MAFDLASVKQTTTAPTSFNFPLGPGDVYIADGGLLKATNFPLSAYIMFAYKITNNQEQPFLFQLPKWVTTVHYDIDARKEGNPTKDQMRLMMQSLLADHFRLVVHYETRQVAVFALVMAKPGALGPLLEKHADDAPCPKVSLVPSPAPTNQPQPEFVDRRFPVPCEGILGMPPSTTGRVRSGARNVSMQLIASSLTGRLTGVDRPVVDRTGLTGTVDFAIEFTPQVPPFAKFELDPSGPTFVQALEEQLGLRLEPQMGPLDLPVVDYIEPPVAN